MDTEPIPPRPAAAPPGPLRAILFALLAIAVQYVVVYVVTFGYGLLAPDGMGALAQITPVSPILWVGAIAAFPCQVLVLAWALRGRGALSDQLALHWPSGRSLALGIILLAVLIAASDGLTMLLGRDVVPPFMRDAYAVSRDAGTLPILAAAVAVAAPVWEELLFRGFLFPAFAATALGAGGAIAATALIWAVIHIQYDWYGIANIFVLGLALGWLRWRSGSTLLTIALHMIANLFATLQAGLKVAGYF